MWSMVRLTVAASRAKRSRSSVSAARWSLQQPDGVVRGGLQHAGGGGKVDAKLAQHEDVLQPKQFLFAVTAAAVVATVAAA